MSITLEILDLFLQLIYSNHRYSNRKLQLWFFDEINETWSLKSKFNCVVDICVFQTEKKKTVTKVYEARFLFCFV